MNNNEKFNKNMLLRAWARTYGDCTVLERKKGKFLKKKKNYKWNLENNKIYFSARRNWDKFPTISSNCLITYFWSSRQKNMQFS